MKKTALIYAVLGIACWGRGPRPVAFEPNRGQEPGGAEYVARGPGYAFTLREGRAELTTMRSHVTATLVGARAGARAEAEAPLPDVVNYLVGADPNRWLRDLPTYARVRYRNVYPGIDVVYYGNDGRLEFDFALAPGADPRRIRLRYQGALGVRIDTAGDLALDTADGGFRQHRPSVYQESGGVRREVAGRYAMRGKTVGFEIGRYDAALPLVIDPALTWATYLNAYPNQPYGDSGEAVAVDAAGNVYAAGTTVSSSFALAYVYKLTPAGAVPSDTAGRSIRTVFGGNYYGDDTEAHGIAVDSFGNVYVVGHTDSPDFPLVYGQSQPLLNYYPGYSYDAFAVKLNSLLNSVTYSYYIGGYGDDYAWGIALDSSGAAYVTGYTNSANFVTTTGAQQPAAQGGADGFVVKFSAAGPPTISTILGGSSDDFATSIAVDQAGGVYVGGFTSSANFPVKGAFQQALSGTSDAFLVKYTSQLTTVFSTYLGGSGDESSWTSVAVDSNGSAYLAGETTSTDFPTVNPLQKAYGGGAGDLFVSKFSPDGASLVYSTYLGGSGEEHAWGLAVDDAGDAYVAGDTASSDFPVVDAFQPANGGVANGVVAELNAAGSALVFSSYLGGSGGSGDWASAIAVSCPAGLAVTGTTSSSDFPATAGAYQPALYSSGPDAFVARIGASGLPPLLGVGGVVNAATSASAPVAPGSLISIYGSNMGMATGTAAGPPWPFALGGAGVAINAVTVPLYYVRMGTVGQINAQLPYETPAGTSSATLTTGCGTSAPVTFQVAQAAPYIFPYASDSAIVNPDGSVNGPSHTAKAGDTVVAYLTGIGPTALGDKAGPAGHPATGAGAPLSPLYWASLPYSATIGGQSASVYFLGLTPQSVGLAQANITVPTGLTSGKNPLLITVGGVASNAGNLYVR